jgi:hypothetical protein
VASVVAVVVVVAAPVADCLPAEIPRKDSVQAVCYWLEVYPLPHSHLDFRPGDSHRDFQALSRQVEFRHSHHRVYSLPDCPALFPPDFQDDSQHSLLPGFHQAAPRQHFPEACSHRDFRQDCLDFPQDDPRRDSHPD